MGQGTSKQEKNDVKTDRGHQEKVDHDIREGAGAETENTGAPGSGSKKEEVNPEKFDQQKSDRQIPDQRDAPNNDAKNAGRLSHEDVPESSNESTGIPGSGQRQDTK